MVFKILHAVLAGFFCEDWGLFEPTGPCQAGYYCIAGTLHVWGQYYLFITAKGSVCCLTDLDKLKCATSQGVNFQNPDGNFSTGVGGACPKGRYCPEGTSLPLPCPPGTYANRSVNPNITCAHVWAVTFLFYYICLCLVAVSIWQTSLAVAHVQLVSSVVLQVSLVHLDCVRQDFTVQGETQQPQVEWQNMMFFMFFMGSNFYLWVIDKGIYSITPSFLQDKPSYTGLIYQHSDLGINYSVINNGCGSYIKLNCGEQR